VFAATLAGFVNMAGSEGFETLDLKEAKALLDEPVVG
jgi:hypothetical protein